MLNSIGLPRLLLTASVTMVLFGRGGIGALMADTGRGITAIRRGLRGEGDTPREQMTTTPGKAQRG